ncbi:MAG: DNA methyltransferase [Bacteroidales bacterium]|jgi:DNA modification methylase|nr:DNA methyltransferase [Bacteroidales bacterium]MDI9575590.1 DNA methyltransferase [Bacteroidota bacterium]MDD3755867.1 DNA methyltransferase [Bacteroidales bacterium]MDY0400935.1 DNA methyltransferase [Bacteroidales bacterium]HOB77199.1 DNA methyltransferase [Bacteroidales bacterium]
MKNEMELNLFEFNENDDLKKNVSVYFNKEPLIKVLDDFEQMNDINKIKKEFLYLIQIIENPKEDRVGLISINNKGDIIECNKYYIITEINTILKSQTIERIHYYIKRLKKSLLEVKTNKINDLNLNQWKKYDNILTDSLWILDKRDSSGAHNAGYWGNFIPQIPNQFLQRYTKKNEWVLDPFLGSGTTLIECKRLGRNGVGVELLPEVVELAEHNISLETNIYNVKTEILNADSTKLNFKDELKKLNISSVQFLIMHPPYWDIIKFSENPNDLSNANTIDSFLDLLGKVVDNTYDILDNERYMALVIGDKYSKGEWIPLGFYCMQEVLKRGYLLKSIIVKNFEETKGKMNQKELWRYRALAGGFYVFKHEYIFLFQKSKK